MLLRAKDQKIQNKNRLKNQRRILNLRKSLKRKLVFGKK